ncbi:hypothetical protein PG988_006694 [Apiospora saccharicola]
MDPVSLAASVAGLTSLGIQVTGGISTYLDALKCRDEELEAIRARIRPSAIPLPRSREHDLDALDDFVAQLAGSDRSAWRLRLTDKYRALHFAFDRPKIRELGLLRNNATEFLLVHSGIAATHTPVMDIRNRIPRLEDKVNLIEPQLETHSNLITHQISEGTRTTSEQIGHVTETVQASFHMQQEVKEQLAGISRSLQTFLVLHGQGSAVSDEKGSLAKMAVGLATKPAALEEACNTYGIQSHPQRVRGSSQRLEHANAQSRFPASSTETSTYRYSACICRGRTQKSRVYSRLSPLYIYSDHTEEGHSPLCPLYRAVPIKEERTYGARLIGLTRIVEIAVGITFGARFGAGGRSISPQFTYIRTVDRRTDPAFRVVECLREVLLSADDQCRPTFYAALEQKALGKIIQWFSEGRSSPYAVDSENQTLMHCVFHSPWLVPRGKFPSDHFIKGLISNGVPAISYDIYGQSPVTSGSGPLIMAVKTRDREQVLSLLSKHADAIEEQNYLGQTALHVAAYENSFPLFPELIEAAKMANIFQKRDNGATTMLEVIVQSTGSHCVNGIYPPECTQCHCADSLAIILDRCLGEVPLDDWFYLRVLLSLGSHRCRRLWLSCLKDQREALRQLAVSNQRALRSIQHILTKGDVLDLYSIQVSALLQQNGIKVPEHLIPYRSPRSKYQSIYCLIDNISLAEQLFEWGFRDIDYDSRYGRPPLAIVYDPSLTLWLLKQGADPTRVRKLEGKVSGKDRWISSAHYAMYGLGKWVTSQETRDSILDSFQAASLITVTTASNCVHDGCFCACSSDGCTPFICYLKGRRKPWIGRRYDIHKAFPDIFQNLMVEDAKLLYCSAMRFESFEVLRLKHTCCYSRSLRPRWDPDRTMDRDDIFEIQDEQADLIETVECLSRDFESGLADVEGDLRDLQAYYDHYWVSRVLTKLEEIERSRMTDEERRKAELLGVEWESDKSSDENSDSESGWSDSSVGWTEDNWEYKLESVLRDL